MNMPKAQRGAVLLVGLIILMTAMAAGLMALFGQRMGEARKELQTVRALTTAKEALLGRSVSEPAPGSRPGELPCPDRHAVGSGLEGVESANCAPNTLGRLPWKTLGLPDLRDGYGERLWYARSVRFRNHARYTSPAGPLNPDTAFGQITVRSSDRNNIPYLAASPAENGTGAVAVIIAPGPPIRRNDNLQQNRVTANYLIASHYLDCWGTAGCNVEDNANFLNDSASNGFIMGPIRLQDRDVVNDRIVIISRDEILGVMQKKVANSVAGAIEAYSLANGSFPSPADASNPGCLGTGNVTSSCAAVSTSLFGRLPGEPVGAGWTGPSQFLDGGATTGWFQQNRWREHVFYAVAPDCRGEAANCNAGGGRLTVNNHPYAAVTGKQAVIILGGPVLAPLNRATPADLTNPNNYLEEENRPPVDTIYSKRAVAVPFNDVVVTIPRLP